MKRAKRFRPLLLIVPALAFSSMPLMAQPINVTIRCNSATLMDTLSENHYVQIRGELNGVDGALLPDYNIIAWDETSDLVMTNIGGDYWEMSLLMMPDDTILYKFWTGFDDSTGTSVVWDGWEGDIIDPHGIEGNNRALISGTADTVVALQYYNSTAALKDQYFRPYTEYPDSLAIHFRVNMAGWEGAEEFDPEVDIPVEVYGGTPLDPTDAWSPAFLTLNREATSGVGADFWSGTAYLATADVSAGTTQEYKFVFSPGGTGQQWEDNISNRWFTLSNELASGDRDTTLHWAFFDNRNPLAGDPITTDVTWTMDPGALQELGFFDRSLGDRLLISGPKGWDIPDQAIEVIFQPLLDYWIGQETFSKYPGDVLQYKYLVLYDSSRVDTLSANYIPGLPGVELWEEPSSSGGSNRTYTILDQSEQLVPGDFGYDFQFYAAIPPEGVIPNDITVTFNINMAPAADSDVNTDNPLFRLAVDEAYIHFESPLLMLTQELPAYEHTIELSDPDGDGIYSGDLAMTGPTVYQIGFRVGYTTDTDNVLHGGGFQPGRRYYQFIWPESHVPGGETVWPSNYELATVDWVPSDLPSETPPDFDLDLGVGERNMANPSSWYLESNYPNPFNPSTTLTYRVGAIERVTITVYSVLGRKVRTLVDSPQSPGVYKTIWDGRDASGRELASGVYFVRMSSASFTQARKIALIR